MMLITICDDKQCILTKRRILHKKSMCARTDISKYDKISSISLIIVGKHIFNRRQILLRI